MDLLQQLKILLPSSRELIIRRDYCSIHALLHGISCYHFHRSTFRKAIHMHCISRGIVYNAACTEYSRCDSEKFLVELMLSAKDDAVKSTEALGSLYASSDS